MVLTRKSHSGEVCPLSDHSYTDTLFSLTPSTSARKIIDIPKVSLEQEFDDCLKPESIESMTEDEPTEFTIIDFPTEILEKFFSFLPYKMIGEFRLICQRFNRVGSSMLNLSFQKLQTQMLNRLQATKALMPRRESARRKHPLARESDILETLHMRLSLLQMTFGKHIERKYCCFFAGEILDEVYRIMRCMKSTPNMGKVFKITDELFDLSAMAMEYFKEYIEPTLPEISYFGSEFLQIKINGGSEVGSSGRNSEQEDEDISDPDLMPPSNMVLRKRIRKIRIGMKKYNNQMSLVRRQFKTCRSKVTNQGKQLIEYASRMEEYDKKVDETSRKLSSVLQELNKCKTELQYWRSKSPGQQFMYCNCGRLIGQADVPAAADNVVVQHWMPPQQLNRDVDERVLPFKVQNRAPAHQQQNATSSSIKNLEPLFDLESKTGHSSKSDLLPAQSWKPLNYSTKPMDLAVANIADSGKGWKPEFGKGRKNAAAKASKKTCESIKLWKSEAREDCGKRSSSEDDTDDNNSDTIGKRVITDDKYSDTVGKRVKLKSRKRIRIDQN